MTTTMSSDICHHIDPNIYFLLMKTLKFYSLVTFIYASRCHAVRTSPWFIYFITEFVPFWHIHPFCPTCSPAFYPGGFINLLLYIFGLVFFFSFHMYGWITVLLSLCDLFHSMPFFFKILVFANFFILGFWLNNIPL